jgi:Uma2 family endonuclease
VFQPDLLIVRHENRDILTEAGAEGAPDLIVEILSVKTRPSLTW